MAFGWKAAKVVAIGSLVIGGYASLTSISTAAGTTAAVRDTGETGLAIGVEVAKGIGPHYTDAAKTASGLPQVSLDGKTLKGPDVYNGGQDKVPDKDESDN